jgi:hypothetical protein
MTRIFALCTRAGTAAAETALCEHCLNTANAQRAKQAAGPDVEDGVNCFVDCSENEILRCTNCGANRHWTKPENPHYQTALNDLETIIQTMTPGEDREDYLVEFIARMAIDIPEVRTRIAERRAKLNS